MQKVLIVGGEKNLKDQLTKHIENIEIVEVSNAVQSLPSHFDVCIIDINSGNVQGFALAREFQEKNPYQQIIMHGKDCDETLCLKAYSDLNIVYFFKDDFSKLIEKIRYALNLSKKLNNRHLRISKRSFYRVFNINEIRFIMKVKGQKKLQIHYYQEDKEELILEDLKGVSINEIPMMLDLDSDLMQIGRGCIINPNKIERVDFSDDCIKLKNIETPIPFEPKFKKSIYKLLGRSLDDPRTLSIDMHK